MAHGGPVVAASGPAEGYSTGRLVGLASTAAMGGVLFGFDSAVINGANTAIATTFDLGSGMMAFVVSIALIGSAVGAWFAGQLADSLGRRRVMLIAALLFGASAIATLLGWALRADSRRPLRAVIVTAFCLVTAACLYRVRADTWQDDNLVNGDRYFYISRVLLVWLLVLEWDATPRAVAWTVRALCLGGVLLHVPHFIIPALPNYRWAEHCDPIRRGEPANIYTLPEGWWIEYVGRPKPK